MHFGFLFLSLLLLAVPGLQAAEQVAIPATPTLARTPTLHPTLAALTAIASQTVQPVPEAASATPTPGAPPPSPSPGPPSPTAAPSATPTVPAAPGPAPTATAAPTTASRGNGQWVTNPQSLELWSSPDGEAVSLGRARPWSYFELTGSGGERRLYVYYPPIREYAWIDADAVGPASAPPASYVASPPRVATINLPGRTLAFNVRSWPRVAADTYVRQAAHNSPVFVTESVRGDDGEVWYRIGDGEYVHATGVRVPKGPPQLYAGRWIDVDLAEPTLMTAYEDDRIVYTALALRGTVADSTPTGVHRIIRRVANETMDSSTLGIPRESPRGWYLENVLYTQYFTGDGASIHYNYWSSNFGYAGSHGCLGVNLEDALWFWNWATVGTVLSIH